jgi:hypothetical protein
LIKIENKQNHLQIIMPRNKDPKHWIDDEEDLRYPESDEEEEDSESSMNRMMMVSCRKQWMYIHTNTLTR